MNKLHIALLIIAGLMLVKCEEVATFAEYDNGQAEVADSAAATTETEGSVAVDAGTTATENTEETPTETQTNENTDENTQTDAVTEEAGSQQTGEQATEEAGSQQTGEQMTVVDEEQSGETAIEDSGEPAQITTTANTKEEKNEDMAAETEEMYKQSNLATMHAQSIDDLNAKLFAIRKLYASKRAADQYTAAQAQVAAFTGVEKELQNHSAPMKDFPLPAQMPVEPMLLRRYKQLQRFDAPLPVEPMPSLYFNRPGKPEKYGNYLEADSDHTLYPKQYYPAQPSVIERRNLADKFEQFRSTIPNYPLIDKLNVNAIRQGMVY